MTDDEIQVFLSLKYSNMQEVLDAFKSAVKAPHGYIREVEHDTIVKAIAIWVEMGAPLEMTVPDDKVDLFLRAKFGNLKNAHNYWLNLYPGERHGLTDAELKMVMDYVNVEE